MTGEEKKENLETITEVISQTGTQETAAGEVKDNLIKETIEASVKDIEETPIKESPKKEILVEAEDVLIEDVVTEEPGTKASVTDIRKHKTLKRRRGRRERSGSYKGIIILGAILAVLGSAYYFFDSHTIVTVNVTGNQVVSEDVIRDAVLASAPLNNTLLLRLDTKFHPIKDIPFVAKIDVDIEGKDTVNVTVYEKSLSGCVEYMNGYVFFDKDGMVLEAGNHLIKGVPCIKGLKFDNWEMGERLPVSDTAKFQYILSITQLVEKYDIELDGIKFTPEDEIELTCGDVTVELGRGEYISIQMMNLGSILEQLKGMKGILYMKDFKTSGATASFSRR